MAHSQGAEARSITLLVPSTRCPDITEVAESLHLPDVGGAWYVVAGASANQFVPLIQLISRWQSLQVPQLPRPFRKAV